MKTFEADVKDSSAKIAFDASLKMWDNAYFKGGKYEDGGMNQSAEINLMDKSTNSLKQLNLYMGILSKLKMAEHKHQQGLAGMPRRYYDTEEKVTYPPLSALGDSAKTKK
jgi:hypothetical protein